MALDIVPLREQHLEGAATLVAANYLALRQAVPVLPLAYERSGTILPLLRQVLQNYSGVVAISDGKVAGLFSGLVIPNFLGQRCAYSPEWANGAGWMDGRLVYEQMYARMCALWAADGCSLHAVSLMASAAEGLAALQSSGFGIVAVDAVRSLAPVEGPSASVKIRQAAMRDVGTIMRMGEELTRHLAAPPTFWAYEEPDYSLWLRQANRAVWLAEERNRGVGMIAAEYDNPDLPLILRDDKTVTVSAALTAERSRRTGIGTALLNQALEWARSNGYERCSVNSRTANYVGARFWLKRFLPASYSLLRWIPPAT